MNRRNVGAKARASGAMACVDCLTLGQQRDGEGRPPRCSIHHRGYRAWYQRKWRYEQRHGSGTYPDDYEPMWIMPRTASVTIAASEVDKIDGAVATINTSIIAGLARVRLRAQPDDQVRLTGYSSQLAQIAEDLAAVAARLRDVKPPPSTPPELATPVRPGWTRSVPQR